MPSYFRSRPGSPSSGVSSNDASRSSAKDVLKTTLKIAEKALDGLPIPGARGTIGVLLEIISGLEKTMRNSEGLSELALQLQMLSDAVLEPLAGKEEGDISPELRLRVNRLAAEWEYLPPLWKKVASHSRIRRFFERDIEGEVITDITQKLRSSLDVFCLSGDVEREIIVGKTLAVVISSEEYNLLKSLPTASASYNASTIASTAQCFTGTREKLIADIKTWLMEKPGKGSPIFWLSGIAGIGKSTVARTIAAFAEEQQILGASFFFSRTDGRTNPAVFFTTIAYQLALAFPEFKKAITDAIRRDPMVVDVALPLQIRKLIVGPLRNIGNTPALVVIIVDALDECVPDGVTEILVHLLAQLPSLPSFKVLVTSRPEHHISHILQAEQNTSKIVMHDIEKSIVESDVKLYIEFRFEGVGRKFPNSGWFWELHELAFMVRLTGNLFIYAVTAMHFIENPHIRNPRRQLERLLKGKSTPNTPLSPFAQLDKLHDQVVCDSVPPGSDSQLSKQFRTVVGAVVGLEEPLSLLSIEKLMGLEEGDTMDALAHLPSVIAVPDSSDGTPRIYHPSFLDYITNPARCKYPHLVILSSTNHLHILQRCFVTMGAMLKRDLCHIANCALLNSDIEDLQAKVDEAIPPWLRYAVTRWPNHLAKVPSGNAVAIAGLETFCTKNLLHWIEACALLGSLSLVIPLIRQAHEWAINSNCTSQILELLNDTLRLIPLHYDTIKKSTLHLYHSVLPFLPLTCAIATVHIDEVRDDDFIVLGGREECWDRCINVLRGHTDIVRSVAFSQDGKFIVSGSYDRTARVWEASTGQHMLTLEGHTKLVTSVMFAPDGKRIVTGSSDKTVCVWDAETGRRMLTFTGHTDEVRSISFSWDGELIVSGSHDQTALVWHASSGQLVSTLKGHTSYVWSVGFSWDGKKIVTGSLDMTARVWDAVTGEGMLVLKGHTDYVSSVSFSQDGKFIVSGSSDDTIRIWDSKDGQLALTLIGHTDEVRSVLFSQDGKQILSGSDDHTVRVWDAKTGQQLLSLEGHTNSIASATFSRDGKLVASSSADHTIRLWDASDSQKGPSRRGHREIVNDVAFSQDGEFIVSASDDMTACIWDAHTGQRMLTLEGHSGRVACGVFSYDGKRIITGSSDRTARTWDTSTGLQMLSLNSHDDQVECVAFSQDGKLIASGPDDSVHLSDGDSGQKIWTLEGHTGCVWSVTFSRGGALLASGSGDTTIRIWEAVGGRHLSTLNGHTGMIRSVAFSQDDRFVVSGSDDCTARLWDAITGECLDTSAKFSNPVNRVRVYSTNPCVVQLQVDGEIRYWTPSLSLFLHSPYNSNLSLTPAERVPLYPLYSVETRLIMVTSEPEQKPIPIGWLPPSFKATKSDLYGSTMVAGGHGGEVFVLKLPAVKIRS